MPTTSLNPARISHDGRLANDSGRTVGSAQLREQFEVGNVNSRSQEFPGGFVDFLLGRGARDIHGDHLDQRQASGFWRLNIAATPAVSAMRLARLHLPSPAAQTRIVSVARIRLDSWKFVRPFKGIFCDDISEFESYHPSHAVRSPPAIGG
jgi:hypothetical protein